jgi:hypothetical protein
VEAGRARLHSSPTFENGLARLVAHVGGFRNPVMVFDLHGTTEDRKILRISYGLQRRIVWVPNTVSPHATWGSAHGPETTRNNQLTGETGQKNGADLAAG